MENTSVGKDDSTVKTVQKRYEGLVSVRTKAIRGKGAWYWTHLEPILVRNPETGLPKAVKLRCGLCDGVFSASNPSRTASEHLKRGTCPNFTGALAKPLSSSSATTTATPLNRKRARNQPLPLSFAESSPGFAVLYPPTTATATATTATTAPVALSGGKEDLEALAVLEDSVKKLKSPKGSPGPGLTKVQVESAVGLLADWLYESCGTVSFSSVDHPKFKSFLEQIGLPPIDRWKLAGAKLDARFEEVRAESEARLRDTMFFQLASDGWAHKSLVSITVNLPNGTSLFRKAVFADPVAPAEYAEEVLWGAITAIGPPARCAGIVANRFKAKALRKLESQNHWMVNLCCQLKAFGSLIKDFGRELPLFRSVTESCLKLLNFFNSNSQARNLFHRYQLKQSPDHPTLIRLPSPAAIGGEKEGPFWVHEMLQDVASSATVLQMIVRDDSYKLVCQDDPLAREIAEVIDDMGFLSELDAALSLVILVKSMVDDMESDRPLVGQCLPLWEELRSKVKEWCMKYNVQESLVEKVMDRRFKKNYHPAWSAAYVLDPLYLHRDAAGKYLPPFKQLTPEQEKDVDKLITRLVSPEEAPIALHELMKWRSEGLDPLYAQAVQVKQRDPLTGKMKVVNPASRRLVWETCLSELSSLRKVAVRLIFLHTTSSSFKWKNWSFLRWVSPYGQPREAMDKVQKMLFIAAHAKMERRDFSSEEEKDAELFSIAAGGSEDDVLNEVLLDSSV